MQNASKLTNAIKVYCTTCGAEFLRQPVTARRKNRIRICFKWFDREGLLADNCPGCGAATSSLSTSPTALSREAILARLNQLDMHDQGLIFTFARRLIEVADGEG